MWNVTSEMIPVMIGATGTISQSLRQYLSNIQGKREIKEVQKQPYLALHTLLYPPTTRLIGLILDIVRISGVGIRFVL